MKKEYLKPEVRKFDTHIEGVMYTTSVPYGGNGSANDTPEAKVCQPAVWEYFENEFDSQDRYFSSVSEEPFEEYLWKME